ncbi:MAG: hypothetical protein AB7T22_10070 [Calditrichaceae bacterium]
MNKKQIEFEEGKEKQRVNLLCLEVGRDLQIIISGGESHIGAIGLGICYDLDKAKANSSVISVHGHKEDDLVKKAAYRLSKALRRNVAVSAGIHYDDLTGDDISAILANVDRLIDRLIDVFKNCD